MSKSIFRKTSLERLSSAEQIDCLLVVGNAKSWLIISGVFLMIAVSVLWGFFGEMPDYIEGNGMLLQGDGLSSIYSGGNGIIEKLYIWEFAGIKKDDVVAILRNETDGTTREVKSMFSGRVMEILAFPGDYISAEEIIASVESEDENLTAVLFVPMSQGKKIKNRMQVNLNLSFINTKEYGYLQGWVRNTSFYPVSQRSVAKILGNEDLANEICRGSAMMKVEVELLRDIANEADYVWTSRKKQPYELSGGTECNGMILTGIFRPIELLFP